MSTKKYDNILQLKQQAKDKANAALAMVVIYAVLFALTMYMIVFGKIQ